MTTPVYDTLLIEHLDFTPTPLCDTEDHQVADKAVTLHCPQGHTTDPVTMLLCADHYRALLSINRGPVFFCHGCGWTPARLDVRTVR